MGISAPRSDTFYSIASGYLAASHTHARTFGTVYKVAVPGWTIGTLGKIDASGDKVVAPFVATTTPLGTTCPCLGIATSTDEGATWSAQLLAKAGEFSPTSAGDTARYPSAAVDPRNPRRYAVVTATPDPTSVQVFTTENGGRAWTKAVVRRAPINAPIARAGKIGLGYTSNGKLLAVWRGFQAPDNPDVPGGPGPFDTFAALLHGNRFGPTIRVSPHSSSYPVGTTVGSTAPGAADYNLNNGAGDFQTWITGSRHDAFVAFPYAPGGRVMDTYLAKIPLSTM